MNPRKLKVNLNHYIFMLYKSAETRHPVSLPCKDTNILIFVTCGASFYLRLWSVQPPIQSLYLWVRCIYILHARMFCTLAHTSSIPMGAINFYMLEHFFALADTTSIQILVCLLFPWVQCQSLKPVLSQCSQSGFVTVDDFIALYTCSYVFNSHGCNKFLHARTFFTLAVTVAQIFNVITEVWPRAKHALVTNN